MQEVWKSVPGFENFYEVSNTGFVRSLPRFARTRGNGLRTVASTILKTFTAGCGYCAVGLAVKGQVSKRYVHRLVASAFIENPCGLPEVNHKDSNKSNNAVTNLEWISRQGNEDHKVKSGRSLRGDDSVHSKLTSKEVAEIRVALQSGESQKSIARRYSVAQTSICRINVGKSWVAHSTST
jgi:hypothetical protein